VIRAVHAAAGIGVLEPGPSYGGVFLDDGKGHPSLLQTIACKEPGHPGADDKHVKGAPLPFINFEERRLGVRVLVVQPQLPKEEGAVVFGQGLAGDEIDHLPDHLEVRRRRQGLPPIAIGDQRFEGRFPDLRLIGLRDPPLGIAHEFRAGLNGAPKQGRIPGQVHQGAHERRNVGACQSTSNRRVIRRDRCPGIKSIR
jgi:hypothetical protein